MEIEEQRKIVAELEEYIQLCNDEHGEYLEYLSFLSSRTFCMSEEFEEAFYKELRLALHDMKQRTFIRTVTVRPEPYEIRELVWHDD